MFQLAGAVEYTNCISAKEVRPPLMNVQDMTKSDGEAPVMLELWGIQSTPLLPSLPGPLR